MTEASLTLALLRGGAPNSEVLVAKGVDDLRAIAERHGISIPLPNTAELQEAETPVMRDTKPSIFEPPEVHTSNALSRARAWRYQHMAAQAEAELQAGMEHGPAMTHLVEAEAVTAAAAAAEREAGVIDGPAAAEHAAIEAVTHRVRQVTSRPTGEPSGGSSDQRASVETYEGEYDDDGERCGRGQCVYEDGTMYVGEWSANLPNGLGRLYFPTGDLFEGTFVKGVREGAGTYAYADGRIEVARYANGANARGEGAMWSPRRSTCWRILRDGEEVEEISVAESAEVAQRVGQPVPGRFWREERMRGAATMAAAEDAITHRLSLEPEAVQPPTDHMSPEAVE